MSAVTETEIPSFLVNLSANPCGTSLVGYFYAGYAQLQAALGDPLPEADGYKVSTEWCFEGPDGQVFTLYDYKETNLYGDDLPTVEEFRALPGYTWHIGAHGEKSVEAFAGWLANKLGVTPARYARCGWCDDQSKPGAFCVGW